MLFSQKEPATCPRSTFYLHKKYVILTQDVHATYPRSTCFLRKKKKKKYFGSEKKSTTKGNGRRVLKVIAARGVSDIDEVKK